MNASKKVKSQAPKEATLISDFNMRVAASYFSQDVIACLHSLIIDTKQKYGWNQADIARRIQMDETQLSHLLSGRRTNMTVDTIALMALAMDHEVSIRVNPLGCETNILDDEKIDLNKDQWDDSDIEIDISELSMSFASDVSSMENA